MDLKETSAGCTIVAAPVGRIDLSTTEKFQEALMAVLNRAPGTLVLDLSGVEFMTSGGFRMLVILLRASKAQGKNFGITGPLQDLVGKVFPIFHAEIVFTVFDTAHDAVAKLDPDALAQFEAAQP